MRSWRKITLGSGVHLKVLQLIVSGETFSDFDDSSVLSSINPVNTTSVAPRSTTTTAPASSTSINYPGLGSALEGIQAQCE